MQASFSDLEYAAKKRIMRRDRSLSEVDAVSTWSALVAEIEPLYAEGDGRGQPPIGVLRMLRLYITQQFLGLSDEGIEDAIYDSQAIRGFIGVDLNRETAPDATILLKFRHPLKENNLTELIFITNNTVLAAKGLLLREGAIEDTTIIDADCSTKKRDSQRVPKAFSA
jgi:IS5 family transposase